MLAANRSYRVRISYLPAEPDQIAAAGKVLRLAVWRTSVTVPDAYPRLYRLSCRFAWQGATFVGWDGSM